MKKIYIAPGIKVRRVTGASLLAGSIGTGISDDPATGGGRAKGFFDTDEENDAPYSWDKYKKTE